MAKTTKKMTKAAKVAKAPASEIPGISMIAIGDLIPSPDNPRRIDPRAASFLELVASVKSHGVLVPLLARPHPDEKGKFDVRAGHRRLMAAGKAKLDTVPVIVRDMTDTEAMEVTVLENLQRVDLHPIEEARGVLALMQQGRDAKQISARIGKSPQWVMRRAALADLAPEWADLAEGASVAIVDPTATGEEGTEVERPSVAHLELMARFPRAVQSDLFARVNEVAPRFLQASNYHEFATWVAHQTARLKGAPFNPRDVGLVPHAGSCLHCAKRSSCNPGLFDEELDEKRLKADDTCLDRACYDAKTAAAIQKRFEDLEVSEPKVIKLSTSYSGANRNSGVFSPYDVMDAKKDDEHARPALMVDGPQAGKVRYVILHEDLRTARQAQAQEPVEELTDEQKATKAAAERWVKASELLAERIESAESCGISDAKTMLALIGAFDANECLNDIVDMEYTTNDPFDHLDVLSNTQTDQLLKWMWQVVRPGVVNAVRLWNVWDVNEQALARLRKAAGMMSIDLDELLKQVDEGVTAGAGSAGDDADDTDEEDSEG